MVLGDRSGKTGYKERATAGETNSCEQGKRVLRDETLT